MRNTLSATIRAYGGRNTNKIVEPIGCTPSFLIEYIGKQFLEGMSWDNRGEWHIDHIQPLFTFDLTDVAQFNKASHHTNLRPLWAKEHMMIRTSKYKKYQ